ncbi:hypothetical protein E4U27_007331 [Claviceps purpurea]|nr:hypothetical protein E4U27_007331 [Claviceps purpurea]
MPYIGLHDELHDGLPRMDCNTVRAEGVPGATRLWNIDTMMAGGSAERVAHRVSSQFTADSSPMWPFDFEIGNSPPEAGFANSAKTDDCM